MAKFFLRRTTSNNGDRLRSFGVNLFIIATCIMSFTFRALTSGRISDFTIIFRMRPIARIATITVSKRILTFRGVLSSGQGRLFKRIVEAMIIKATNSDSKRLVNIIVNRRCRVNAHLTNTMETIQTRQNLLYRMTFNAG